MRYFVWYCWYIYIYLYDICLVLSSNSSGYFRGSSGYFWKSFGLWQTKRPMPLLSNNTLIWRAFFFDRWPSHRSTEDIVSSQPPKRVIRIRSELKLPRDFWGLVLFLSIGIGTLLPRWCIRCYRLWILRGWDICQYCGILHDWRLWLGSGVDQR